MGNVLKTAAREHDWCRGQSAAVAAKPKRYWFSRTILPNQQRSWQAGELQFEVLEHFVIVDAEASQHVVVAGFREVTPGPLS